MQRLQRLDCTLAGLVPGELLALLDTVLLQLHTELVIRQNIFDLFGDRIDIKWIEQSRIIIHDLRQTGPVGRNDRPATGHGFQGWQAEAFVP
ncbi:hypothetical protein D3C77_335770 [compost metagenome]